MQLSVSDVYESAHRAASAERITSLVLAVVRIGGHAAAYRG